MTLTAPKHIRGRLESSALKSERLDWLTEHRDHSQAVLARALRISPSGVSQRLSRSLPDPAIIYGLRQGFGCDDIAVMNGLPIRKVREAIRILRATGVLASIYTSARAEARGGAGV